MDHVINVIGSNNHWVTSHFSIHYLISENIGVGMSLAERMHRNSDRPQKQEEQLKTYMVATKGKAWTLFKVNQATWAFYNTAVSDSGCK